MQVAVEEKEVAVVEEVLHPFQIHILSQVTSIIRTAMAREATHLAMCILGRTMMGLQSS